MPYVIEHTRPAPVHALCGKAHSNACPSLWGGQVEILEPTVLSRRAVGTLEERIVFHHEEWRKAGYDQPDGNLQFWHHALMFNRRMERPNGRRAPREELADFLWLHTGEISRGHIVSMTYEPGSETQRLGLYPDRWPERLIPESGGSVDLPDRSQVTVKKVATWWQLADMAGWESPVDDRDYSSADRHRDEILAAFNREQGHADAR